MDNNTTKTPASSGPVQKAVMAFSLCLLLLFSAPPVTSSMLGENEDLASPPEETMDLIGLLRSVVEGHRLRDTLDTDLKQFRTERQLLLKKRGFGIAGLDNVDMITSTLDRSRSRSRSRVRPQMSLSVDLNQLRALMAKAG